MSKKRKHRPKRSSKTLSEIQRPAPQSTITGSSNIAKFDLQGWKFRIVLTTLISLVAFWYYWSPISISASQFSTDPDNPFTHRFSVKNNFVFPIYSVYPECLVKLAAKDKPTLHKVVVSEINTIERLSAFDSFDATCPVEHTINIGISDIDKIDLSVCIRPRYTLFGIPVKRHQVFRFTRLKNPKQHVYWSQQPAEVCEVEFASMNMTQRIEAAARLREEERAKQK